MAMDTRRLQEVAGKHACEARTNVPSEYILQRQRQAGSTEFTSGCDSGQLKLAGFDDDCDWSDDPSPNASATTLTAAGAELRRSSTVKAGTEMEVLSPLVRSIFEGQKKMILDAGQKVISKKDQAGGVIQSHTNKQGSTERQRPCRSGVPKGDVKQALDEEIAIFKKESKRVKNLAKEHEEGLTRLARENGSSRMGAAEEKPDAGVSSASRGANGETEEGKANFGS